MTAYYLSRLVISIILGGLFVLLGAQWWLAALTGLGVLAVFIYLPFSGYYTVHRDKGPTPFTRDEFSRSVTDRSARNAYAVMTIAIAGIMIYAFVAGLAVVTVDVLGIVLALGVIVFFMSGYWLRRM